MLEPSQVEAVANGLTINERAFLEMCLNYDNIVSQLSDNYSNAGLREAIELMGSKHAAAGLLSSLHKKGLGYSDNGSEWGVHPSEYHHTFWLSELGVRAAFHNRQQRDCSGKLL